MFYTLCYNEFMMKKETMIVITPDDIKKIVSDKYGYDIKNIKFDFIKKQYKSGSLDGVQMYSDMEVFNGIKIKIIKNV